jgi:predicted nucleotidyltransferase
MKLKDSASNCRPRQPWRPRLSGAELAEYLRRKHGEKEGVQMKPEATHLLKQYRRTCLSSDSSARALPRYNTSMSKVAHPLILEYAEQIAREFHPEKIILFGSYAYGEPKGSSDVDILVIMPFEGKGARKAAEILLATDPRFPVDLIVRTPNHVAERIQLGDFFIREVTERGEVLYEAAHA